jgi:hypothetical protein
MTGLASGSFQAANIIVAAANSSKETKARADFICDGKQDQIKLLASFPRAGRTKTVYERNPNTPIPTECYAGHSVEWLAGAYYLDDTLVIPDAEDCAIHAEGARFHYLPAGGDAVVLTGLSRCRFQLGTIFSSSTGAALRVKPTTNMPSLMSIVGFTGLIGTDQKGIGLCVDSAVENVCTMRFEGTDIRGFDIGVLVPDARPASPDKPGSGKTDTNWYWLDYVRMCNTCIWERRNGIDSAYWFVNVDARITNAVAIRTAGSFGRWFVIMGSMDWHIRAHENNKTRSIFLDPGANHNVIEVTPPLAMFAPPQDNSGNDSNVILCTSQPMKLPAQSPK